MVLSVKPDLQYALQAEGLPDQDDMETWVMAALHGRFDEAVELSIRIVDEHEGAELNEAFRGKSGPTNVLSFPYDGDVVLSPVLLGDIVICAPVVKKEAAAQKKLEKAHWCHMVIHGVLHLLGYDHITDQEAEEMEAEEVLILSALHYANPYEG